jgi:hypothetical protein
MVMMRVLANVLCCDVSMGMSNNDLVPLIARLVEEGGAVRIGGCGADSNSRRFFISSSPHSHLHFPAMMPSFPARINTSICHRRASLDHCTKRAFALQMLPLKGYSKTPRQASSYLQFASLSCSSVPYCITYIRVKPWPTRSSPPSSSPL